MQKNPISLSLALTQILELEKDIQQIKPLGPLSAHLLWTTQRYLRLLALLYKDALVSSNRLCWPKNSSGSETSGSSKASTGSGPSSKDLK